MVIHRANEELKSSPIANLERWCLHNDLFGDQGLFLGAVQTAGGLRLLMDDCLLSPIDLRVQAVSGALLDIVTKLTSAPRFL